MLKIHNYRSYLRSCALYATIERDSKSISDDDDNFSFLDEYCEDVSDRSYASRFSRKPVSTNKVPNNRDSKMVRSVLESLDKHRNSEKFTTTRLTKLRKYLIRNRKHRHYLRTKAVLPALVTGPMFLTEMSKMSIAAALGVTSIPLTMSGIIGVSLPSFFFFHMMQYYAPDKFKFPCKVGKYTFGLAYQLVAYTVDHISAPLEDHYFGEELPLDVGQTGGTIPFDFSDANELKDLLEQYATEYTLKSYD